MTNPPTPPRPAVPEMPKPDFTDQALPSGDGSDWRLYRLWEVDEDNISSIERYAASLESELAEVRARAERAEAWRDAVVDAAVIDHIPLTDPKEIIHRIVEWNMQIALDPSVSDEARKLRDTYKAECERLREALSDIANGNVDYRNGSYEAQSLANELWAIQSHAHQALTPKETTDE